MILIDKSSSSAIVYDFDTTLSFPVSANDYLELAIRDEKNMLGKYHRYIVKIISSQLLYDGLYLVCFE